MHCNTLNFSTSREVQTIHKVAEDVFSNCLRSSMRFRTEIAIHRSDELFYPAYVLSFCMFSIILGLATLLNAAFG